ncbi:MAG: nucleoside 2-deoxyribosyltransferase, partial [Betaproteobacteria bacterium]|nr:nucleoside 2-deoxyribosyltransferase [Betaproteobacteria bacterium]
LIPAIAKSGVTPINPWAPNPRIDAQIQAVQAFSDLPSRREAWTRLIDDIGGTNAKSIQRADGVVAVLDGVDVDSGTAAELGYAAALGKWIVGYRGDFRRTGDDETATVNLQVEYFIRRSGGVIVRSLAELDHELRRRARAR